MIFKSYLLSFIFTFSSFFSLVSAKSLLIKANSSVLNISQNPNSLKMNWHLESANDLNSPKGINFSDAIEFSNKEIVIAIIDSGVDINNKSLENQIWINKKEIPNNKIDDDGNGYVDDIVGWNFLGSEKGSIEYKISSNSNKVNAKNGKYEFQITNDSLEITRRAQFLRSQNNLGQEYKKLINQIMRKQSRAIKLKKAFLKEMIIFEEAAKSLNINNNLELLTLKSLMQITPKSTKEKIAFTHLQNFLLENKDFQYLLDQFNEYYVQENFFYNIDLNQRKEIINDDTNDFQQTHYGNNNVIGFNSYHGTKVASLISAVQHQGSPVKGVATNLVKIMPIRAIPNGDERDKDIVNAIHYAVDNGANIINMSFGKYNSPNNDKVTKAISYARDNNVLIVLAAGNDYSNISKKRSYPYPFINENRLDNTLTVGSSSPYFGENIVSRFTNYGEIVDILAPGEKLYTVSSNNKIVQESGTSLSAPLVSATASLILKAKPDLEIDRVVHLIKENGTDLHERNVYIPDQGVVPINTIFPNPSILNIGKIFSKLNMR